MTVSVVQGDGIEPFAEAASIANTVETMSYDGGTVDTIRYTDIPLTAQAPANTNWASRGVGASNEWLAIGNNGAPATIDGVDYINAGQLTIFRWNDTTRDWDYHQNILPTTVNTEVPAAPRTPPRDSERNPSLAADAGVLVSSDGMWMAVERQASTGLINIGTTVTTIGAAIEFYQFNTTTELWERNGEVPLDPTQSTPVAAPRVAYMSMSPNGEWLAAIDSNRFTDASSNEFYIINFFRRTGTTWALAGTNRSIINGAASSSRLYIKLNNDHAVVGGSGPNGNLAVLQLVGSTWTAVQDIDNTDLLANGHVGNANNLSAEVFSLSGNSLFMYVDAEDTSVREFTRTGLDQPFDLSAGVTPSNAITGLDANFRAAAAIFSTADGLTLGIVREGTDRDPVATGFARIYTRASLTGTFTQTFEQVGGADGTQPQPADGGSLAQFNDGFFAKDTMGTLAFELQTAESTDPVRVYRGVNEESAEYTLTNGSGQDFPTVTATIGGQTFQNGAFANGATATQMFDSLAARAWSVSLGNAGSFSVMGAGITDTGTIELPGNQSTGQIAQFFADYVNAQIDGATATVSGNVVNTRVRTRNTTPLVPAVTPGSSGAAAVSNAVVENAGARLTTYTWTINNADATEYASGTHAAVLADTASDIVVDLANDIVTEANTQDGIPAGHSWAASAVTQESGHMVVHITQPDAVNRSLTVNVMANDGLATDLNRGLGNSFDGDGDTAAILVATAPTTTTIPGGSHMITALSGETVDALMGRMAALVTAQEETPDWTASYNTGTNVITYTADNSGSHDGVWNLAYTDGSAGDGNISITATTVSREGSDRTWAANIGAPSHGSTTTTAGGVATTLNGVATELAAAITVDSNIPASATSAGAVITVTSTASDWFNDRVVAGSDSIRDRDTVFTDRDLSFALVDGVQTIGTTGLYANASSFTTAAAQVQQGHPIVPQSTVTVDYAGVTSVVNIDDNATANAIAGNIRSGLISRSGLDATGADAQAVVSVTNLTRGLAAPVYTLDDWSANARVGTNGMFPASATDTTRGIFTITQTEAIAETDQERPWPGTVFNFSREFVVTISNTADIHTNDIGFTFGTESYESFVERRDLLLRDLVDNTYVKSLNEMNIMGSGSEDGTNVTLDVNLDLTNAPGVEGDLSNQTAETNRYTFTFTEDYKVDIRDNGRMLNYRITDTGNATIRWRISGIDLMAAVSGTR